MALFFIIVLIAFLVSLNYPDFMFWLALTIFMDPGGYLQLYLDRSLIGGIQLLDLQFVLLMIPLLSPKIKLKEYFKPKDNRWIFNFLLFFTLFYHIFIYGFINTKGDFKSLIDLIQYERLTLIGFVSIIPAYIFFKRNSTILIKFAIITSLFISVFYIITILTGIQLVPTVTFSRGLGTDAMRISMLSYGFADFFISTSLILLLFNIYVPYKRITYFIGIILFIAVILTLTRRSIIAIFYTSFIIYYLHQKIIGSPVISTKFAKYIFGIASAILVLFFIQPDYIGFGYDMIQNTLDVATTGGVANGEVDGRFEHDIPAHLDRFKQAPILGYGYDPTWYSNIVEEGGLSANDVPLTAALGMFGLIGLFIFSIFYVRIFKILLQTYYVLKASYNSTIHRNNLMIFIIGIVLLGSFITRYTLNFMSYFSDLILEKDRVKSMILLGILLAVRDILNRNLSSIKPKS